MTKTIYLVTGTIDGPCRRLRFRIDLPPVPLYQLLCGCIPGEMDNVPHLFNAANVRAGVEYSLRTLNTDYIDLVQFHHSLNQTKLEAEGALEAYHLL